MNKHWKKLKEQQAKREETRAIRNQEIYEARQNKELWSLIVDLSSQPMVEEEYDLELLSEVDQAIAFLEKYGTYLRQRGRLMFNHSFAVEADEDSVLVTSNF